MPFVPDTPAPTKGRFVPDAPDQASGLNLSDLVTGQTNRRMGTAEGIGRMIQRGLTMGWGDEISGAADAAVSKLRGDPRSFGDIYDASRARYAGEEQRFAAENPRSAALAEGTGAALTAVPAALATGGASAPATVGQLMARGGASGAAVGAVAGAGGADPGKRLERANEGAALGGLLGAGMPLVPYAARGAQAAWRGGKQAASNALDLFRSSGPKRIADRTTRDLVADDVRGPLVEALTANRNFPDGFRPTAAQQVAGTPEGTLVQSLEAQVSRAPGGRGAGANPSVMFARRDAEQGAALEAAKKARNELTGKMRATTLKLANDTTARIQELGAQVRDRYLSKANALQQKGQFDTEAAIQSRLADQKPPPGGGPVTDALGIGGRTAPSAPPTAAGAAPRAPGRYTPQAARAEENATASAEMPAIIRQRQAELEMAQRELQQLRDQGADPLTISRVQDKVNSIMSTPGLRASTVVQKAMDSVTARLQKMVQADGTVNAHDVYMLRKELGNEIESAMKESSSFDKKLAGSLRDDVQNALDSAIESALPAEARGGWRQYLETYAAKSKQIDDAVAAAEAAYKPKRGTNVGQAESGEISVPMPATLSRGGMLARSIAGMAGRNVQPKVDVELARLLMDPAALADTLARTPQRKALIDALTAARAAQPATNAATSLMVR